MRATTTVIAARRTSALSARPPSSSRAASSFSEAIGQLAEGGHGLEARWYIFAVIGVALLVDVSRIVVSVRTARRYKSAALRSNALHFAGDMAGTIAVLGGMVAVAGGFEQGDAVAALVVACLVFAAAGRLGAGRRGRGAGGGVPGLRGGGAAGLGDRARADGHRPRRCPVARRGR